MSRVVDRTESLNELEEVVAADPDAVRQPTAKAVDVQEATAKAVIDSARREGGDYGRAVTEVQPTKRVAIVANIAWHIFNFRLDLIRALETEGFETVLFASPDEYASRLTGSNRKFVALDKLSRTGLNPVQDIALFWELVRKYRDHRVDLAIHYTSKGNIYGGMACRLLGIPSIHTINGLGGPFSGRSRAVQSVIKILYREALRRSNHVFFQNEHDFGFFVNHGITKQKQGRVVDGSGVDLGVFNPDRFAARDGAEDFRVLHFCRLSKTKGVLEYVEAARELKRRGRPFRFLLAGKSDHDKHAIPAEQIDQWVHEGLIDFVGQSDNVAGLLADVDVVVYPSFYMEGIPRALIEACAMAKPIITTDHVGCRETVVAGENGFLVPVGDANGLADAIEWIAAADPDSRARMGEQSRQLAVERFDEKIVNAAYVTAVRTSVEKGRR